jgi:micrococcal nuclease
LCLYSAIDTSVLRFETLSRKFKNILFSISLSLLIFFCSACIPTPTATDTVRVTMVIDGDTVIISTGQRVRYIGMDTPEMFPEEAFAREATRVNRELVQGKVIRLEKDVSETDKYGRLLRYVWVDGTMVNIELTRRGLAVAKAYPPDTKYRVLLEAAELQAKFSRRGMWAQGAAQNEGAGTTPPPD